MATAWVFAFAIAIVVRVLIGGCSWWATPTGSSYCSGSCYSPTIEACGCYCFGKRVIIVKGTTVWAASGQYSPLARTVSGSCWRGRAAGARIGKRSAASGRRRCLKHYSASVIARQVCWVT